MKKLPHKKHKIKIFKDVKNGLYVRELRMGNAQTEFQSNISNFD